ncbi:response regulator [Maricaulis sp.]|uniref:response regulator n=1 Tax=Maricaulis sp. TaxID=1486257 RepID=UPI003A8EB888
MSQIVPFILLDDDPDEHFLFRTDLEDAGFDLDIHCFIRPDDALGHLSAHPGGPVVVLTDIGLSGADAIDFICQVVVSAPDAVIGVYSGAQNPDTEAACRAAGASFYIVKPISDAKLESVVAASGVLTVETLSDGRRRLVSA